MRQISVITESEHPTVTTIDIDTDSIALLAVALIYILLC